MGDCGAYIGAVIERQAIKPKAAASSDRVIPQRLILTRFHNDEPSLN
jgi:hypothetical protein